jgi:general secretion pathway protein K
LLIVLWVVVAAALLVSAFNATVKSGVSFIGSEIQLSKTEALLDAGLELAVGRLIDEEAARRWLPNGRPHIVSFAGRRLAISITDPSGLIDLNKADPELLLAFLRRFAGNDSKSALLRDSIVLARNKHGRAPESGVQQTGEEARAGRRPAQDARPFIDVAQVRTLKGMTPEIYEAIARFLTVYSRDGRINPRVAPPEVLAAVPGLTETERGTMRTAARQDDGGAREAESGQGQGQGQGGRGAKRGGGAYHVTVQVLRQDGASAASAVFIVLPGADQQAPYRLIAKRPTIIGAVGSGV